jgi:Uma2 family endonuclease
MAGIPALPSGVDKVVLPLSPEDSRRYFESICAQNPDLRLELTEEGHIILTTPVGLESSFQSGEVFRQLANWSKKDGTGIAVESSAGFRLPSRAVRAPDAAWVSWGRLSVVPPASRKRFIALSPDFAVEVMSPSDEERELIEKCRRYIKNGTREVWLLNPETRRLFVYLPDTEEVYENPSKIQSRILKGFTLRLRTIWKGLDSQ